MNELKIFENEAFGEVRCLEIENKPWFVGKDVAQALGYVNHRDALSVHVENEDKKHGVVIPDSMGRSQMPVLINESGMYSLILSSKLPTAKQFKHWVTSEVLPSLRKTGTYQTKLKLEKLSSINNAVRTILPVVEAMGMTPVNKAYLLKQLYGKAGIELPIGGVKEEEKIYTKEKIAKNLGVYSESGKPHKAAIGAIIEKLEIKDENKVLTSFESNGHVDSDYQYKTPVLLQVESWLKENEYPRIVIRNNGTKQKLAYNFKV